MLKSYAPEESGFWSKLLLLARRFKMVRQWWKPGEGFLKCWGLDQNMKSYLLPTVMAQYRCVLPIKFHDSTDANKKAKYLSQI